MSQDNLAALVAMGFDEALGREALAINDSVEGAVQWILSYGGNASSPSEEPPLIGLKMVCVIRSDLGMTPGKVAAQTVHAALGAVRRVRNQDTVRAWEGEGERVICLKCASLGELQNIYLTASRAGLPVFMVLDAGRTEVEPGSATVVAIGPALEDHIDSITRHLRLY